MGPSPFDTSRKYGSGHHWCKGADAAIERKGQARSEYPERLEMARCR